jgi:hypothetical protein
MPKTSEKEILETTKIVFQSGGYKTSIPKKIVKSLDVDGGDTLVWSIANGKLVSVSPLKDVLDRNKFRNSQITE